MQGIAGGKPGFADECRIRRPGADCENGDKGKFGTPAEKMIKRAADQRRESRSGRGCDRDRRHRLCQRLAVKQIPGNGA
jgi:hypothetical protein